MDKFNEKNIEKVKYMNEIKNIDKNNDKKLIEKQIQLEIIYIPREVC